MRSKLVPAQLPEGLVVRDRVLDRLSVDDRFTLVSAMPGFGKTAAIRHWIERIDVPVCWLSLDLLDQEPMSFWSHLVTAVGSAATGVDDEPAMLLSERGAGDLLFLSALVAQLAAANGPVVLVLDGLAGQLDRTTLDGLALLVERAGETLRVVVTTRSDPPLPLARWRSRGWLNDLREDELRLTDDEALAVAAVADTSIRDADAVVALNRRVDGWPIGLHMALLTRPADDARSAGDLVGGSDRLLANYLVVEVLEAMPEAERDVALSLSVLEWFDPDLCAELLGADAADAVRALLGRGMFLLVVDPRVGSMRFHDLFRELMEMELGFRDPARRLDLHRRAALAWRARGDLMSAYRHLTVIGEAARAHELLVGPALQLVDQGDLDALHRFARQLPTPLHVSNASLAVDLGVVAYYAEGTLAARAWCDRAAALLDAGAPTDDRDEAGATTAVRLHGLRCAIALLEADLDAAVAGIDEHRRIAADVDAPDDFESRFPILAGRVMLGARRMAEADEWIARAEDLERPDIITMVTVPTLRAWYEWMFGRLDVATDIIDGAARWMADHRVGAHHLAFDTLITAGWCRLSTGDLADANRYAERASADAQTLANAWNQLQAGFLTARLAVVTGDPLRALDVVDDLRAVVAFDTCRPYAERLLGVEIEALASCGRTVDADQLIAVLQPGPRALLLRARFQHHSDAERRGPPRRPGGVADARAVAGRGRAAHPPPRHHAVGRARRAGHRVRRVRVGAAVPRPRSPRRTAAAGDPARRRAPRAGAGARVPGPDQSGQRRRAWCAPDESRAHARRAAADPLVLRRDGRAAVPVGEHGEVEPQGAVPQARRRHACRGGGGQPARRPDLSAVSDRHGLRRRTPSRNTQNCHTSGTRSTETTPNSSTNGRPSFQ